MVVDCNPIAIFCLTTQDNALHGTVYSQTIRNRMFPSIYLKYKPKHNCLLHTVLQSLIWAILWCMIFLIATPNNQHFFYTENRVMLQFIVHTPHFESAKVKHDLCLPVCHQNCCPSTLLPPTDAPYSARSFPPFSSYSVSFFPFWLSHTSSLWMFFQSEEMFVTLPLGHLVNLLRQVFLKAYQCVFYQQRTYRCPSSRFDVLFVPNTYLSVPPKLLWGRNDELAYDMQLWSNQ